MSSLDITVTPSFNWIRRTQGFDIVMVCYAYVVVVFAMTSWAHKVLLCLCFNFCFAATENVTGLKIEHSLLIVNRVVYFNFIWVVCSEWPGHYQIRRQANKELKPRPRTDHGKPGSIYRAGKLWKSNMFGKKIFKTWKNNRRVRNRL